MSSTTFRNASGLPDAEQVSTARDFATLTRHLIQDFPEQYHYFAVPAFMFHGREVPNHDPMLRIYPGADGLKTGYTVDAGLNLVTSAVRGNVRLIGVVLGARTSAQRSNVMVALLDQAFQQEGVPVAPRAIARGRRATSLLLASDTVPDAGAPAPQAAPAGRWHRMRGKVAVHLAAARGRVAGIARAASHGPRVRLTGAKVHLAGAVAAAPSHGHAKAHGKARLKG